MSSELNRNIFKRAKGVWLTPLINRTEILNVISETSNKGFCILGDKDKIYSEKRWSIIEKNQHITTRLIPNANHRLEDDEDFYKSFDILKSIITDIEDFLLREVISNE
jgi:hypothetical protein